MVSALITADLHLSDNPRDRYRLDFIKELAAVALRRKVDVIFILGDLTQEKDRHSAWMVNTVVAALLTLSSVCRVVVLKGNHDYIDPDIPFYRFAGHLENVTWINVPTTMLLPGVDSNCILLPHTTDPKRDWAELKLSKFEWIFAHATFAGASVGGRPLRGIPLSLVPERSLVISGDVHVPQEFENIVYVGAPYRINFGDDFVPRLLVIENDGKITAIEADGPRKQLLVINSPAELLGASVERGDLVKVRLALDPGQAAQWPSLRSQIAEWAEKAGVKLALVQPMLPKPTGERSHRAWKSDAELLEAYAEKEQLEAATVAIGRQLLGEA